MPELDLTTDSKATEGKDTRSAYEYELRHWNPLIGIVALLAGFLLIGVRYFQVVVPLLLLLAPFFGIAFYVGGHSGLIFLYMLFLPVIIGVGGYMVLMFCVPSYLDIIRMTGIFLQRLPEVAPAETIEAVNQRWASVVKDWARIKGWFNVRA